MKTLGIGVLILFGWILILFGCNRKLIENPKDKQISIPFGVRQNPNKETPQEENRIEYEKGKYLEISPELAKHWKFSNFQIYIDNSAYQWGEITAIWDGDVNTKKIRWAAYDKEKVRIKERSFDEKPIANEMIRLRLTFSYDGLKSYVIANDTVIFKILTN